MPNIAVTFRQEITRLARREIRSQTQRMRKASAQFRKDIAELKRHALALKSEVTRLARIAGKDLSPRNAEANAAPMRFSARGVAAHRRVLGTTAKDYGTLIGVAAQTIYKWEHGTSRPRKAQLAALASIRDMGKASALARLEQLRKNGSKGRAPKR